MLKLEKRITLHTFDVEYIDQREPKPRAVHHELCVLAGACPRWNVWASPLQAGFVSSMPGRALPWALSTRASA